MSKTAERAGTGRDDRRTWHVRGLGLLLAAVMLALAGRGHAGEYVPISDTAELYVEEAGEGQPIIFIPGWTMTTEMFARQLEHFSKNYRAITYDPRGQGRSSKTDAGNTYVQHARDLKALMDALGLKDVVLVSWSWGVLEHLAFIREFGDDNIAASVFIDGSPKPLVTADGDWGDGVLQDVVAYPRTALYDRHSLNTELAKSMLEDTSNADVLAWIEDQSMRTPDYIAALLGYDAMFSDYTEDLESLDGTMPVLQVLRKEWSKTATDWIGKNTPHAETFVLGKHMMFWERADAFNHRLDQFLNAVFAPPAETVAQPSDLVRQIQLGLAELGYNAGPADGMPGASTEDAIRQYEKDHNLLVTGIVSEPLLAHIEAAIEARNAAAKEQAAKPKPEPEPAGPPANLVRGVQEELAKRGYDVPRASGELNPQTVAAVRVYQRDAGLLVDGTVSEALLENLRQAPVGPAASMNHYQQVRYVQTELNKRGYDAGPEDGAMGRRTRNAIEEFQKAVGLAPTGEITPGLIQRISTEPIPQPQAPQEQAAAPEQPKPEQPKEEAPPEVSGPVKLVTRLYDDFSDGNYTRNPAWTVRSGQFRVENGAYLRTYVAPPPSTSGSGQQSVQELGTALLQGVLNEALGTGEASKPAQIFTPFKLKNAFRIEIELSSQQAGGQLLFGPYQGSKAAVGYRVAYTSGAKPSLQLLAVTKGGTQVVASADRPVAFEDGRGHIIEWSRFPDGRMVVTVDGNDVIVTRDRAFKGDFAGFTLINTGGDFAVNTVQVDQPK